MTPSLGNHPSETFTPSQGRPETYDQAEPFDPIDYLLAIDPDGSLMASTEGRRQLTESDPLAFALVYFADLLTDREAGLTLSEAHLEWCDEAKSWMTPGASRDCYVASRGLGKSTWWFLILPLWAAAFGYVKFIAAFAASAQQAYDHLAGMKRQIDTNDSLRSDFPDLCRAMRRPGNSKPVGDRENRYVADSGFTFDAYGTTSKFRGIKSPDGDRPDLIILDDFEDEDTKAADTLAIMKNKIFYTNDQAKVVISGTVPFTDSLMHDLVRSLTEDPADWVKELKPPITVHHHVPIIDGEDGPRSIWPGHPRFQLDGPNGMLARQRDTDFLQEYMNTPLAGDGALWLPGFFKYGTPEGVGKVVLSVDPAVSTKKASDYTGLAVVGLSLQAKAAVVFDCWQLKRSPEDIRAAVLKICEDYPVTEILIETNQGGDWLKSQFHDMPVAVKTVHQKAAKEFRAARAAGLYSRGSVFHAKNLTGLEAQMLSFPKVAHDDMVDAVSSALIYFADALKMKKQAARNPVRQSSYL